jgi:hypothetical protein
MIPATGALSRFDLNVPFFATNEHEAARMKPVKDVSGPSADGRRFAAIRVHSWRKFLFCVLRASDRVEAPCPRRRLNTLTENPFGRWFHRDAGLGADPLRVGSVIRPTACSEKKFRRL